MLISHVMELAYEDALLQGNIEEEAWGEHRRRCLEQDSGNKPLQKSQILRWGRMAKDLLLERCLVKVMSRSLRDKIKCFCARGHLRPERLLIVFVLYAGVSR